MVWLTWRQHRMQVVVTAGFLLVLGMIVLAQGDGAYGVLSWLPVVPLLIGIFWGAPVLAAEVERGTHRLVWTQSVSRRRWLAAKLGGLGLAVTVAGLGLGLMVSGWATAHGGDRFGDTALFGGTGIAVGAWWLFAFLLGASAGGLTRRLLPAMAVTVVVFLVAMYAMFQARPEYAEPLSQVVDTPNAAGPGFVTGAAWLSPAGTEVMDVPECVNAPREAYLSCVQDAGYRTVQYYQPADRYWQFQWTETGILLLFSALLAAPVAHRVLRRPV